MTCLCETLTVPFVRALAGASRCRSGTKQVRPPLPPPPPPVPPWSWFGSNAVKNGHIKRITDGDINSSVLEIAGANVSTTYITCPSKKKQSLGIKLPFLVIIIKNMKKYFTFEVTVLDDKNVQRRFRASNYQSATRVKPFVCSMPMRLDDGWNQIQFNLMDFTRRAYGTNYVETVRVQVHANCRLRRIYFSDRLYSEKELPKEFNLFVPREAAAAPAAAAAASAEAPAEGAVMPAEAGGVEELPADDMGGEDDLGGGEALPDDEGGDDVGADEALPEEGGDE
jgi:hypothetical protein